jgi:membrane-bound metal-dependent hydrolase YbcI (DUF457 family)
VEGKTHRLGGVLCTLLGYSILEANGMLIENVNPLLQLTVVYPFALYGSVFSDLDHSWQSSPAKDPFSFVVNRCLHMTTWLRKKTEAKGKVLGVFDAKHRSWQTHSDLFLLSLIAAFLAVMYSNPSGISGVIFQLVSVGFICGVVSHLMLDMLTPEGIWCILPSLIKGKRVMISLVPNTKFFVTGGKWEKLVRFLLWAFIIMLTVRLIYLASPYRISFSYY